MSSYALLCNENVMEWTNGGINAGQAQSFDLELGQINERFDQNSEQSSNIVSRIEEHKVLLIGEDQIKMNSGETGFFPASPEADTVTLDSQSY